MSTVHLERPIAAGRDDEEDRHSPQTRRKYSKRDSGIPNDADTQVITGQPTGKIPSFPDNENYEHNQDNRDAYFPHSDQYDQCCMCKIGSFSLGFPKELRDHQNDHVRTEMPSPRSPSLTSGISGNSDSAFSFYEGPPSSARPSSVNPDHIKYLNASWEDDVAMLPRSNTSKRVSFADYGHELKRGSQIHAQLELSTFLSKDPEPHSTSDNISELDFILQCIEHSSQKHAHSPQQLAGKRFELDNFAAVCISNACDGVKLTIPGTRISLYIPPFALSHLDEPQIVYIYRHQENEAQLPHPDGKEVMATPVIECGPSGLSFSKPVFLTMPYTFDVPTSQVRVSAYHSKHAISNDWQGLRDGEDTVVIAQEKEVTILISNFCKYGCTVQSTTEETTKWMKASVDVDQEEAEGRCKIVVQLCDLDKVVRFSLLLLICKNGEYICRDIFICLHWIFFSLRRGSQTWLHLSATGPNNCPSTQGHKTTTIIEA